MAKPTETDRATSKTPGIRPILPSDAAPTNALGYPRVKASFILLTRLLGYLLPLAQVIFDFSSPPKIVADRCIYIRQIKGGVLLDNLFRGRPFQKCGNNSVQGSSPENGTRSPRSHGRLASCVAVVFRPPAKIITPIQAQVPAREGGEI